MESSRNSRVVTTFLLLIIGGVQNGVKPQLQLR